MSKPDRPEYRGYVGQADMLEGLRQLIERVERGEVTCAALRLFHPDGTWEDVVVGGNEEEQAQALANLRASKDRAN